GSTLVNGGMLLITGTHTPLAITGSATGVYSVGAGASLGGTGLIRPASSSGSNPAVAVSGTLAPGNPSVNNGIGTLTFDGANSSEPLLALNSGAMLSFNLGAGG